MPDQSSNAKSMKATVHIWRETDRKIVVALRDVVVLDVTPEHGVAYTNLDRFLRKNGK